MILKDVSTLERSKIKADGFSVGELFLRRLPVHPPRWAALFEGIAYPSLPRLFTAGVSAVLLVNRKERTFAVPFGYGRHLLQPGTLEERFGLIVTLNSVPSGQIRSVDAQSFDTISSHRRTQASREGTFSDFGFDVERDLLRMATGRPSDESLGSRLTGMDTLQISVPATIRDLPALLDRLLKIFHEDSYKNDYPWVDQLKEVRDQAQIDSLSDTLIEKLRQRDLDRLWMAVPEIIDWRDVEFRYDGEDEDSRHDDVRIHDFVSLLGADISSADIELLKRRRVNAISAGSDAVVDQWTIYQCLYCEIDQAGLTYLLTGGKWYSVADDFVGRVNAETKKLVQSSGLLPPYADTSETVYNARVAGANSASHSWMRR